MSKTTGILVAVCLCVVVVSPTHARRITVTNTNDSGPGSLRQAILDARPNDEIVFVSRLDGQPITLTSGELVIDKSLSIIGRGPDKTAVDGNDRRRVFFIAETAAGVTLSGMTIKNGTAPSHGETSRRGGGIYNQGGTLTLDNCTVSGNRVVGYDDPTSGGGIYNEWGGTLTLHDCTISDNSSVALCWLDLHAPPGPPQPSSCGEGGGVYNSGTLTVNRSHIVGNHANWFGGAIMNVDSGTTVIDDSIVAGNDAIGGGITNLNGGTTMIDNTTIASNAGGGILNLGGTATIDNSTIADNEASLGAGIFSDGWHDHATLSLRGSTVSGNSVRESRSAEAGAAYNGSRATMTLDHCTISDNWTPSDGAAVWNLGILTVSNTIIGSQASGGDCESGLGSIVSLGYNLDSDGTCHLTEPTDLPETTDPLIGPLADNGGPTWTHALRQGSPAIDGGSCSEVGTDQRGMPCPADLLNVPNADDGCDIGAFEYFPANIQVVGSLHDLLLVLIGEDHDLVAPLHATIQILEDSDPDNDGEAVTSLLVFIGEVESRRGWTLSEAEADELIAEAQRIIALLNSGGAPTGI
jgi:hypothetical protein